MRQLIEQNRAFLVPYLLVILVSLCMLSIFGNAPIHLFINQFHGLFTDVLYSTITIFGDGIFVLLVVAVLSFVQMKHALLIAVTYAVSGSVVQVLKHMVFNGTPRPAHYFEGVHQLYLVPGVAMDYVNSFPSGHSATAFALFFSLALITKKQSLKVLFFIIASLVAYSRVYLSQHFLGDVVAGSIIGTITVIVAYILQKNLNNNFWNSPIQSVFQARRKRKVSLTS